MADKTNSKLLLAKERRLKTYQCDRYGFLRPVSLMNKLQGLAGTHAEMLGAGRETCASQNIAWVLTHMFVDIPDIPRAEEMLTYSTWPSVTGPVRSERDFLIKDEKGKVKLRAISQWVLIDLHTRRPARISDYFPEWKGLPERVWDREFDKGPDFIPTKRLVSPSLRYGMGMHTLNEYNGMLVIDVKGFNNIFTGILYFFYKRIKKLYKSLIK